MHTLVSRVLFLILSDNNTRDEEGKHVRDDPIWRQEMPEAWVMPATQNAV